MSFSLVMQGISTFTCRGGTTSMATSLMAGAGSAV